MNEEEILKECNELAKNKHHELGDCWDEEYSANAIQGLLDLYNQEKEKNKKLEEEKKQAFKDYVSTSAELYRVINMIAEDYYQDYISGERSDLPCEYLDGIKKRKEYPSCEFKDCMFCIKEYYFSKVRGEQDENGDMPYMPRLRNERRISQGF